MKKTLRASSPTIPTKATPPRCRVHPETPMVFRPAHAAWFCTEVGCGIKMLPKALTEDDGRPIVGTGDLEIIQYIDDDNITNYVLRASGNNVCIDVTNLVTELSATDGYVKFKVGRWAITDGRKKKTL